MLPAALHFGSPIWLWGLATIPFFGALLLWAERDSARRLVVLLPAPRLRAQLTGAASVARRRWRYAFLLLGFAALLVTMAQPRFGYELHETHRRGLDVIVIVDVSKSMLATDVAPSRLARAKLTLQDLLSQLTGDRVGLVAFAGTAFLQAPLTIDYDAVLNAADELDSDLIPMGGTNLGAGIDLALEAFGKAEAGNRAILLMSDGEPTADNEQADGVKAATRAAEAGVKVFTMGFGTNEGSLIPLGESSPGEFIRDADGQIVRTRLNEGGLKEIAQAGGGFYVHFENGGSALRMVLQNGLAQLKAGEIDARVARRPIERYQWPLGAALVFLSVGTLLGERRKASAPAATTTRVSGPAARAQRRRQAAAVAIGLMLALGLERASFASAMSPPPTTGDAAPDSALDLYRAGHYDQAYSAFQELAKQHPKVDNLQFDAGASAYMAHQYDQALDAFGKALTSENPSLQLKSHYNFGNTLYRRGEQQKDQKAKIRDWRDAIQHYDTTLNSLKSKPPHTDDALASNTAYNRDLVQHRLDEELKQPPKPQDKQDKKDKQDKQDPKDGQGQPQPQQQDKQDQQNKPDPSQSGDKQQQPQDGAGQQQPGNSGAQGSPPPSGGQQDEPPGEQQQPGQSNQGASPSPVPNQDKPRQRGDFNAQPSKSDTPPEPDKPGEEQAADDAAQKEGNMSPAQARELLQSLRDEDTKVNLNENPETRRRRDEPVSKDW